MNLLPRLCFFFISLFINFSVISQPYQVSLSETQIHDLGKMIWQNEGQQKLQHLTTWNKNEGFPSLGLGHFIWYPNKAKGPFKEQFPELLDFFEQNNVILPLWLKQTKYAPWQSREQFYDQFDDQKLSTLRIFLSEHIDLQTKFIMKRLDNAIPNILASCTEEEKKHINRNLLAMTSSVKGTFALLDYVNFKGEGLSEKEQYQGVKWGLKQVLLNMPEHYVEPVRAFSLSADEILTRRVKNAPRDELPWLKGWRVRLYKYQEIQVQ